MVLDSKEETFNINSLTAFLASATYFLFLRMMILAFFNEINLLKLELILPMSSEFNISLSPLIVKCIGLTGLSVFFSVIILTVIGEVFPYTSVSLKKPGT